jgi:predicted nucleic acid-binding protein
MALAAGSLSRRKALPNCGRRLIIAHQAVGRAAFDVRLVAAMQVHSIAAILTFDAGFARYGVTVLGP